MRLNPFKKSKPEEVQPEEQTRYLVMSSGELLAPNEYRSHIEKQVQSIVSSGSRANDNILAAVVAGSVPAMVCIDFHSTVVSSIPIVANDELGKPASFVPMKGMLDNRMRWLVRDLDKSLSIWNYAMARKYYNREKLPTRLKFLNPLNVRVNTDSKQQIIDYRLNREQETLKLNEVVYISGFDLMNTGDSVSKLENALPYTSLERGIITHATSFFFNGASIAGIVTIEKTGLTDAEFEKFEKDFARRFQGASKAWKVGIFDKQITYTPISAAPADLAMVELSDQAKQFVCAAFGVNPALVGLGDVSDELSASSTYKETRRSFIEMEATPTLDFILDNLNTQWALTDFPIPVHLVSDSSAMAMMNDGISTDDMGVATSGVDGNLFTVVEGREHIGYKPSELDDGWPARNPAWANGLWADGTITLNQKRKMLGIEPPVLEDLVKVDGITYKVANLAQVAEKNLEKLAAPAPSPFGGLPSGNAPMLTELATAMPEVDFVSSIGLTDDDVFGSSRADTDNGNIVMIEGIARQLSPRLIIGIDLADFRIIHLAMRELGRALAKVNNITWVAPEHWRVELAHIDRWSPVDIANMTRVIKWDFNRTEVWTDDYFVNGDGIYLRLQDTEATHEIERLVHNDLRSISIDSSEVVPALAIKLAHGDVDESLLPKSPALGSMPIVFTRIAAFANDQIQHKWRLRAYHNKDVGKVFNQELLNKQRDELSKWQQRVARSGLNSEWAIDCLPEHVVRFVKSDALEELRLLLKKFVEEEHERDPEGKFAPSGGGNGEGEDKKKDTPKQLHSKQDVLDVINNTSNFDADGKLDPALQVEFDDYVSTFPNSPEVIELKDTLAEASENNKQSPTSPAQEVSSDGFIPKEDVRIQHGVSENALDRQREVAWKNKLDDGETESVGAWSQAAWETFQGYGRGEPIGSELEKERFRDFESAINSAPEYDGISWRGINIQGSSEDILSRFQNDIGNITTFDTYASASASVKIAGRFSSVVPESSKTPVIFEIYSTQGKYINSSTARGGSSSDEFELVFKPNSQFIIRDAYISTYEGDGGQQPDAIFVVMEDAND